MPRAAKDTKIARERQASNTSPARSASRARIREPREGPKNTKAVREGMDKDISRTSLVRNASRARIREPREAPNNTKAVREGMDRDMSKVSMVRSGSKARFLEPPAAHKKPSNERKASDMSTTTWARSIASKPKSREVPVAPWDRKVTVQPRNPMSTESRTTREATRRQRIRKPKLKLVDDPEVKPHLPRVCEDDDNNNNDEDLDNFMDARPGSQGNICLVLNLESLSTSLIQESN